MSSPRGSARRSRSEKIARTALACAARRAGLVGDEVASVEVVIGGRTYLARMGENAFGIRLEGTRPDGLDRVVLHRRDAP